MPVVFIRILIKTYTAILPYKTPFYYCVKTDQPGFERPTDLY